MASVVLNGYKIEEMRFVNMIENGVHIKLEHRYSFNIQYNQNEKCVGTLEAEVYNGKEPEKFFAKTKMLAFFTFKEGIEKDIVHREAFKEIYPYAKAIITTLSANAGVPPIIMPAIDADSQSVYRVDIPPQK